MYSLWHCLYDGDYARLPHYAYEHCMYRDRNRLVYEPNEAPQCAQNVGICEEITQQQLNGLEAASLARAREQRRRASASDLPSHTRAGVA